MLGIVFHDSNSQGFGQNRMVGVKEALDHNVPSL